MRQISVPDGLSIMVNRALLPREYPKRAEKFHASWHLLSSQAPPGHSPRASKWNFSPAPYNFCLQLCLGCKDGHRLAKMIPGIFQKTAPLGCPLVNRHVRKPILYMRKIADYWMDTLAPTMNVLFPLLFFLKEEWWQSWFYIQYLKCLYTIGRFEG